ncbi:MAG TPA: FeoB-associated Cys-rich membrane protein [Spirochaetota bacterium]|nr:FeoB-associated Cys-rich membrane protein [Spirochaetota bacterium]HOR44091.1 FeoB-associated Cys-rich membrane protein [Spirochaetota bacterium]HOU84467.1 FeoB-associated Cys-rich membrane protein [Spirochaetota bacterium]HPK56221.1 FeoB-associated Cys-rich membrane protein [Spirochaetota bacterium]HQE58664.1 FeoB-associated Cys-rich membrane protein [Spirochaetota bacterium]
MNAEILIMIVLFSAATILLLIKIFGKKKDSAKCACSHCSCGKNSCDDNKLKEN